MWTAPPPEERAAVSSPPVLDARVPNVVVVCRTVPLAAPLRAPRFVESTPYRLLRLDRCQFVALVYLWYSMYDSSGDLDGGGITPFFQSMKTLWQTSRRLLDKLGELLLASCGLELTENGALQCIAMVGV